MISRTEEGVLLLCSTLGMQNPRPLSAAAFRRLSLRAAAMGMGERDTVSELKQQDLERLGYTAAESSRILALLNRRAALERYLRAAEAAGIYPLTRLSALYPAGLRRQLGLYCPPVLFCRGDLQLLEGPCVSLVGARDLHEPGCSFARRVGRLAAEEGMTLVSGGARGADTEAQNACLAAGGRVAVFAAGSLLEFPAAAADCLLLLSEAGFDEAFSAERALRRNRFIHAAGRLTLAAQTDYGRGGTWSGCTENLKHGWSPVFVCDDGSAGARGLVDRGATAVPPDGPQSLHGLRPAMEQLSLPGQ